VGCKLGETLVLQLQFVQDIGASQPVCLYRTKTWHLTRDDRKWA